MGLSNQIPSSRLIQPGVIANSGERPASPYEGMVIYQRDTNQTLVWDGSAWVIPGRPTVETRFGPVSGVGNTSVANTNWALLRSGIEISISAQAGDVIEVYMQFLQEGAGSSNCYYRMDAGIIVGGSLISYIGAALGGSGTGGFMGGGYPYSDGYIFGKTMRAVTSSEVSNNTLTLRPYIRQYGASATIVFHSANEPFYFGAINHGPDLG